MAVRTFSRIFPHARCNIIGMIHVPALPGTPRSSLSMPEILERVEAEAATYGAAGVDGVIVENMHDTPYSLEKDLGPEVTACMALVGSAARRVVPAGRPVGVQVLAGANRAAVAVALAAGLQVTDLPIVQPSCFIIPFL